MNGFNVPKKEPCPLFTSAPITFTSIQYMSFLGVTQGFPQDLGQ